MTSARSPLLALATFLSRTSRFTLPTASALTILLAATPLAAQLPRAEQMQPNNAVLTHRQEDPLIKERIQERFETLLPELMRREGFDMWLVITREYNSDPVFRSMAPITTYSSRRRTILMFHDLGPGQGVERISVGRSDYQGVFEVYRTHNDSQYVGLRRLIEERDPERIGINVSDRWNHADGLTHNEYLRLADALGEEYTERLESAEMLAVGWLEAKLPRETDQYRSVMRIAHQVIAEAFSNQVIVPGVTTNQDVVWWMRQRVAEMGLGAWFHPSVNVQRRGGLPEAGPRGTVIERGDLLHTDFGIIGVGFSTDTQHNAYVLLPGETDAPEGLKEGLRQANRLQDLTMMHGPAGATGNEALTGALAQARQEGMNPTIYCHAIGYHGHGAGPPIGMTDYQDGVPVRGDYVLRPNTWHSIELNARYAVPEWDGQEVRFALEEDAALLEDGWDWVDGRQTSFYLIR
jgi:Xaa-Pro aminopeptidase